MFISAVSAAMGFMAMIAINANAQQCAPLPTGAVSWWPAESNAVDIVSGNNGILENSTGFQLGAVNFGFYLDGTDDFVLVQATNSSNLNIGAGIGMTIEGWIKPTTVAKEQVITEYERVLGTSDGSDVGIDFAILSTTELYANILDTTQTGHELFSPANYLTNNVWQHVAVTYDKSSGVGTLYINGAAVAQSNLGTFTPQTTFTNLLLGARTTYGSISSPRSTFSGGMDEMTIYDRALYDCEIQAIYNAGSAGKYQ
jgi:hypothetical protein